MKTEERGFGGARAHRLPYRPSAQRRRRERRQAEERKRSAGTEAATAAKCG